MSERGIERAKATAPIFGGRQLSAAVAVPVVPRLRGVRDKPGDLCLVRGRVDPPVPVGDQVGRQELQPGKVSIGLFALNGPINQTELSPGQPSSPLARLERRGDFVQIEPPILRPVILGEHLLRREAGRLERQLVDLKRPVAVAVVGVEVTPTAGMQVQRLQRLADRIARERSVPPTADRRVLVELQRSVVVPVVPSRDPIDLIAHQRRVEKAGNRQTFAVGEGVEDRTGQDGPVPSDRRLPLRTTEPAVAVGVRVEEPLLLRPAERGDQLGLRE